MANKARRRPSWKKLRSKHFPTKWERSRDYSQRYYKVRKFRHEIFQEINKIVQEEIDREILEKIRTMLPEPDGKVRDCKSLRTQFDSGR